MFDIHNEMNQLNWQVSQPALMGKSWIASESYTTEEMRPRKFSDQLINMN